MAFETFCESLWKMCCKTLFLLVIDTTLASDNCSRFRKNLLERIQKLIMATDDKIRDEKLQYGINTEAVKILVSSSGKLINMNFLQVEKCYYLLK